MLKKLNKVVTNKRLTLVFGALWILSILLFIWLSSLPTNNGIYSEKMGQGLGITVLAGMISFVLMIFFAIIGGLFPKKITVNKSYVYLVLLLLVSVVVILLNQKLTILGDKIKALPTPAPTVYVQPVNNIAQTAFPVLQPTIDIDPVVDCKFEHIGSIKLKTSICKASTECQIGDRWVYYDSVNKCKADQTTSTKPAVNTQKSNTLNYYCYNNFYNYWYYTSSGEQCNSDNLKSGTYKICSDTQKLKVDSCNSTCKTDLNSNNGLCAWAYTGPNAAIEQSTDKYGECLNGSGGSGDLYGICLQKCTDQYTQDLKTCQ